MIVIVTGGRDFDDREWIYQQLSTLHAHKQITLLRHGACPKGLDKHAQQWCSEHGVEQEGWPAQWDKYGKAAGPIRNAKMVQEGGDVGLIFPGGSGTQDCADRMRKPHADVKRVVDLRPLYKLSSESKSAGAGNATAASKH